MKQIHYNVEDEYHTRMKVLAAERGISIKDLIIEGVNLLLKKSTEKSVPAAKKIKVEKSTPKVDAILEGRLNELLDKQDIVDVKDVRCKVEVPYDKLPPRMKQLIKDPDEYNEKAEVVTDRTV